MLDARSITRTVRETSRAASVSLGLAVFGCGGAVTQFEPEHASGHASATYAVASYELKVGPSVLGNAAVWSEGAEETSAGRQVLDLEIALQNGTHEPFELDVEKSGVDVSLRDGHVQPLGTPFRIGGSRMVAPDSSGRVRLHYALPRGLPPHEITRFQFNWRIASKAGAYAQSTAFVARPPQTSDAFVDRGQPPCGGVYRIESPHECVGTPPILVR